MKIYVTNNKGVYDISDLIVGISISGDFNSVARTLNMSVLSSSTDKSLPSVAIDNGNRIRVVHASGDILFDGYVFSRGTSRNDTTINYLCYDMTIYLQKSTTCIKVVNETVETVITKLAKEVGLQVNALPRTNVTHKAIFIDKTIYEIIATLFTRLYKKTKKRYKITVVNGKLSVVELGAQKVKTVLQSYVADENTGAILNISTNESIEDIVNKVVMFDEKGQKKSVISDNQSVAKYGTLQRAFIVRKGDKAEPTDLLNVKPKTEVQLQALGVIDCVSGSAVEVIDGYTGVRGLFHIVSDEHTFSDTSHTMSLTLSYEKLLLDVDVAEEEKKAKPKKKEKDDETV